MSARRNVLATATSLAVLLAAGAASACPQAAATGTQPCDPQLRPMIASAAAGTLGSAGYPIRQISSGLGASRRLIPGWVPCVIMSAIAETESTWRQFNASCGSRGSTVISFDCGYGIAQITSGMDGSAGFSPARVAAEPAYDLSVGANILIEKWLAAGTITPNDPHVAEDWYLAIWGYNGFASSNNPNQHTNTRGTYYNPNAPAFPRSNYPYEEIVYGYALYPTRGTDGMPRWPSTRITHPNFSEICSSCGFASGPLSAITPTHTGDCAAPAYAATFVGQSFPVASAPPIVMHAGDNLAGWIDLRNTGSRTWDANTRLATTVARDRASVLHGPDWISASRVAAAGTVAPGATHRFAFTLHAPATLGTYDEHFGMVEDGVAWFSDPNEGGPADNQLEIKVQVIAAVATDAGTTTDAGTRVDAGGGEDVIASDDVATDDVVAVDTVTAPDTGTATDAGAVTDTNSVHDATASDAGPGMTHGGCGCSVPASTRSPGVTWALALAFGAWASRRRRT